jgi:hypothetical protein
MVSEMNRSSMSKQMMSKGGKLNMVKGKDGKMVPDYAADGKGKMKAGGMAKAYKDGGEVMEDVAMDMPAKPPRRAIEAPMSDEQAKEAMAALKKDKKSKADKKSKNEPAKKMMAGGMTKKPKAKIRGYGMARGGKVCKMR